MRRSSPKLAAATVLLCGLATAAGGLARAEDAQAPAGKAAEAAIELQRGDTAKAVAAYSEALKDTGLASDRRAALLTDRAVAYSKAGDSKLALEDFNKAVQLFAEYPPAYNNRGNLLVSLGQYQEAIKDFDRAILLAPKYAAAYSNRANAKLKLDLSGEAINDFTRAIELAPQSAPPLSGRGLAFLASGKPHAAIRDFSRAVNADARFASAYRNRAEARLAVGQGDEAIEDLSRASAFDGVNTELYVVRGYAYLNTGNTISAVKDFSRAIELAPNAVAGYQGRGLANAIADANDDAFADLNRAIELDPRSATAFAYRAYVYKKSEQVDVALKDMERAMKLDPNNPDVLWVSGEIDEARARSDTAVASLRKSLALRPNWSFAEQVLKRLGAALDTGEDRAVANAGMGDWKVVLNKASYFAVNTGMEDLRVPLEMMGEGAPKLLDWEVKKAPFKGYGVLRFASGRVLTPNGAEDTEEAAIIDIDNAKVIAIQPQRQGSKVAKWSWEDDRVQVASIDGVTDEFSLRTTRTAEAAPAAAVPKRSQSYSGGAWAPWQGDKDSRRQAQRRQPKPKTIFDLLFN